jgi:hypothetical protein
VRVVIEDGQVIRLEYGGLFIETPYGTIFVDQDSGVTVTHRAPRPQAGEVWQLEGDEDGLTWLIAQDASDDGALWAINALDSRERFQVKGADFSTAIRVYPPPAPDKTGMLRRFEDEYEHGSAVWTETAPDSGIYLPLLEILPCTRDVASRAFGFSHDLAPVPADAEAVR